MTLPRARPRPLRGKPGHTHTGTPGISRSDAPGGPPQLSQVRIAPAATLTAIMGTTNRPLACVAALHTDGVLQRADPSGIDLPAAERAVRDLLGALGRRKVDT